MIITFVICNKPNEVLSNHHSQYILTYTTIYPYCNEIKAKTDKHMYVYAHCLFFTSDKSLDKSKMLYSEVAGLSK